ncbi:MAG: glutaredoxin [Deltaproteobacteria bacterium]|nr:glutaredoxin [Deltaproteobacteria bacterium]MBI2231521.1 glutaredoxin [Deltaproteobacteria bacterium]
MILLYWGFGLAALAVAAAPAAEIEVFVRPGCPYCAAAERFLQDLQRRQPEIRVRTRDISQDPEAFQELSELAHGFNIQPFGVPAFYLRGQLIIGFASAETTGKAIESLLDRAPRSTERDFGNGASTPGAVTVPLLGQLNVRELGLPVFTIVLGLLDGFNPCAMWVLLFLLSMLVNLRDRRKMFLIGGVFVVVSGLAYFAFMAAWLNLFFLLGASRITQNLLGAIAAIIGILNVKDFFAFGRGPSVGIPAAVKPKIYDHVRRVLRAENLVGALVAVVVLAILVNTVELLCTAGLPVIYTRVLTAYSLPAWGYYAYLTLYNLAYMADDSLMLAIAIVTLSRQRLQEKGGRWLKLVSGVVMLALGLILVLVPEWLAQ